MSRTFPVAHTTALRLLSSHSNGIRPMNRMDDGGLLVVPSLLIMVWSMNVVRRKLVCVGVRSQRWVWKTDGMDVVI